MAATSSVVDAGDTSAHQLRPDHGRGKGQRRRAILDAAHDIIMREGEAGMTMRAMAAQAGVSPATPYNLFGSKQAILQAIFDEDFESFGRFFAVHASPAPLIRIFDLADVSIAYFERQPDFYRALFTILQRSSGSELDANSWSLRMSYMRTLLDDCRAEGVLVADLPVDLVASSLTRIFKAVAQEWADGALDLATARQELGTSFALILTSLVTHEGRTQFDEARSRYAGAVTTL